MKKRILALTLAAALLLTSCGGGTKASTMRLRRTEGQVDISDDGGKNVEPRENLGLYSGYEVETRSESYAWIDLDAVKLTKLDQDSEIEIQKDGKDLKIMVNEGSLFFNVTQPLEDDETMTIRTSSMMVGIRGTCGWVEVPDSETMKVFLLEGKVQCETGSGNETVRAGEMAVMTEDGDITVEKFTAADIPAFVLEEIQDDDGLTGAILDDSGIDLTGGGTGGDVSDGYADVLAQIEGEILYTEMIDFEADGSPELLVLYLQDSYNPSKGAELVGVTVQVWRNGPEGPSRLGHYVPWFFDREHYRNGKISLMESGGRLFIKSYNAYVDNNHTSENEMFFGSIAQQDGLEQDWGDVEMIIRIQGTPRVICKRYPKKNGLVERTNGGTVENLSVGEYEAISGAYNEIKVLVYTPDNASLVVTPAPPETEESPQPAVTNPEDPSGGDVLPGDDSSILG